MSNSEDVRRIKGNSDAVVHREARQTLNDMEPTALAGEAAAESESRADGLTASGMPRRTVQQCGDSPWKPAASRVAAFVINIAINSMSAGKGDELMLIIACVIATAIVSICLTTVVQKAANTRVIER